MYYHAKFWAELDTGPFSALYSILNFCLKLNENKFPIEKNVDYLNATQEKKKKKVKKKKRKKKMAEFPLKISTTNSSRRFWIKILLTC